ncbi:MAG TPA: AMP-binding protein, partial [Mycobacterium sp.]|nr:AMP-binding protein [Mycobacterium sp.]
MAESVSPRIADLVQVAASRRPDAPALVVTADRIPISYRDLTRLVDDLARRLKRAGLTPGNRVGLRAASNIEFVVGLLAASRADLVAVPLDPALPVGEQRARSAAAGAAAVLVDDPGSQGERDDPELRWWPIAVSAQEDPVAVTLGATAPPKGGAPKPPGLRGDDA